MKEIKVKIHEIAKDGYPDMDKLIGRVAFLWDGHIIDGWPSSDQVTQGVAQEDVGWQSSETGQEYSGVTYWIEFPKPFWELGR